MPPFLLIPDREIHGGSLAVSLIFFSGQRFAFRLAKCDASHKSLHHLGCTAVSSRSSDPALYLHDKDHILVVILRFDRKWTTCKAMWRITDRVDPDNNEMGAALCMTQR